MTEKIRALVVKHWEVFSYLLFGVLTTVVNYVVFAIAAQVFPDSATVCNVIAWVVAVAFAYLTNKPFVFRSHDWSAKTVIPELTKFISCRLASGILETLILLLTVDCLHIIGDAFLFDSKKDTDKISFRKVITVIKNFH